VGCSRSSSRPGVSFAFWCLWFIAALLAFLMTSCGQGASPPLTVAPTPLRPAPTRWSFDETARAVLPREAIPLRGAWGVTMAEGPPSPPHVACQTSAAPAGGIVTFGPIPQGDAAVSAAVELSGRTPAHRGGLVIGLEDREHLSLLEADADTGQVRIATLSGTTVTTVVEAPAAIRVGAWHHLRVELDGERVRGFLDGHVLVETSREQISGGTAGLISRDGTTACFDDIEITRLRPS
jgi:hypothetical protein